MSLQGLLEIQVRCCFSSILPFFFEIISTPILLSSDIIKIHLGDQTDAKVLMGTYVCTEVPGEFRWQPGALTQVSSPSL